jgi:hypothetical protein
LQSPFLSFSLLNYLMKDQTMRHARLFFICSVSALLCFTVIGCSSSGSVEGNVTIDGTPVDGGEISFTKQLDKGNATTLRGSIDSGKYSVKSSTFVPGEYTVVILWNKKTGKQIMSSDPPNKIDETIQMIPKKYNTESTTKVDLKAGTNTQNFDLKSK